MEQAHINADNLLKIHGSIDHFIDRNGQPVSMSETEYQYLPHTEDNLMILPDIVFYGENVKGMDQALSWMQTAKNVVIVGTRLNVAPVNQLTLWAKN
ncbi:NAD-dependent deacetylase [Weissella viridescens]|uniref:NAD-dependent deacetylase n=1 Tax=Weissella viridescens TaxID=1629 RepID=A0A380NWR5_WEIVI|nr:NAD-dependent deacetylase [Weissella viridescens]